MKVDYNWLTFILYYSGGMKLQQNDKGEWLGCPRKYNPAWILSLIVMFVSELGFRIFEQTKDQWNEYRETELTMLPFDDFDQDVDNE